MTTAWKFAHIGFEGDDCTLGGLKVWEHEWRAVPGQPVELQHPAHPGQWHDFHVSEIGDPDSPVTFAVCELSAMVYGFYVPA